MKTRGQTEEALMMCVRRQEKDERMRERFGDYIIGKPKMNWTQCSKRKMHMRRGRQEKDRLKKH